MDYIKILLINSCIFLMFLVSCQSKTGSSESNRNSSPEVGSLVPSFTLSDVSGEPLSLSKLRGKYVLLDFWASWCQPCRKENPYLVQAYQQFRHQNFTIYSVSLDHNKQAWQKAIQKDKLIWPYHASDLKGWDNAAAIQYSIDAIPANFLIDPKGKVIAKNLSGKTLVTTLDQFLNSEN